MYEEETHKNTHNEEFKLEPPTPVPPQSGPTMAANFAGLFSPTIPGSPTAAGTNFAFPPPPSSNYPQAQFFGSNGTDKPPIAIAFFCEYKHSFEICRNSIMIKGIMSSSFFTTNKDISTEHTLKKMLLEGKASLLAAANWTTQNKLSFVRLRK